MHCPCRCLFLHPDGCLYPAQKFEVMDFHDKLLTMTFSHYTLPARHPPLNLVQSGTFPRRKLSSKSLMASAVAKSQMSPDSASPGCWQPSFSQLLRHHTLQGVIQLHGNRCLFGGPTLTVETSWYCFLPLHPPCLLSHHLWLFPSCVPPASWLSISS